MADKLKLKRFRTYGQQSRREHERRNRDRKVEVRHVRIEAIYNKTTAPEAVTEY